MRTTLTIDDDLAGILQKRSGELGKSFKEIVNGALRKGLTALEAAETPGRIVEVRPHDFGLRPGIDPDRMNQLNDELEVEAYLEKAARDDSARY